MENVFTIQILEQPAASSQFRLVIFGPSLSYVLTMEFEFVTGTPGADQVEIGATMADTLSNVYDYLIANESDGNANFELDYPNIVVSFNSVASYGILGIQYNADGAFAFSEGVADVEEPEAPDGFGAGEFIIEIFDTHNNDLPLIDEITQLNAPVISYSGGDDIDETFITSKLVFNMLVADSADAHFIHLFTGDEKRYKVKLSQVNDDSTVSLRWQGFLLPDLYREPYKKGGLFIEFTAVDMLQSLKGKFFEPWVHYQKFTNPELISMILQLTGLQQPFIVKPSIVNSDESIGWDNMIISLEPYVNSGKYSDVYEILADVLFSQCLSIYSLAGEWIIEGMTRKHEATSEVLVFAFDGVAESSETRTKQIIEVMHSKDSVNFTSITPWKSVGVSFNVDSNKNLFADDVVKRVPFFAGYTDDAFDEDTPVNTYFRQWTQVGASFLQIMRRYNEFSFRRNLPITATDYNVNEASALVNYFECPETPYVTPERYYELELVVKCNIWFAAPLSAGFIEDELTSEDGRLRNFPAWRLLHDGVEIRSNRPSSATLSLNQYDERTVEGRVNPPGDIDTMYTITYKIKREFAVGTPGLVTFRMLPPITNSLFENNIYHFEILPQVLKISVVDGSADENVRAVRDIEFTQKKDVELKITSSLNVSIPNGFNLGTRIGDRQAVVGAEVAATAVFDQVFPPVNDLQLTMDQFIVNSSEQNRIFNLNKAKSLFLEKVSGVKHHYFSLYTKIIASVRWVYCLNDYEGRPFIPKDYVRLPNIEEGDVLRMLLSEFTETDYEARDTWHLKGLPDWENTYPKTVANAYHSVRQSPSFGLETNMLAMVWPDQLVQFPFASADRLFIPTTLTINLVAGKTSGNFREGTFNEITDIAYE